MNPPVYTNQLNVHRRNDGTVQGVVAQSTGAEPTFVSLPLLEGIVYDGERVVLSFPASIVRFVEPE